MTYLKQCKNAYEQLTGTEKKFIPEESAKSTPNFDIRREDVRKNQISEILRKLCGYKIEYNDDYKNSNFDVNK